MIDGTTVSDLCDTSTTSDPDDYRLTVYPSQDGCVRLTVSMRDIERHTLRQRIRRLLGT